MGSYLSSSASSSTPGPYDTPNNVVEPAGENDYNVQIVIDTTGSMSGTIEACSKALVSATGELSKLGSVKMGLTTYKDYCDAEFPVWKQSEPTSDVANLQERIKAKLNASGGGDSPEAVRTALNDVLFNVKSKVDLVFLFTDAPPHTEYGAATGGSSFLKTESSKISSAFDGKGINDWFKLSRAFEERGTAVITFMLGYGEDVSHNFYPILSTFSGGLVLIVRSPTADAIAKQIVAFTKALAQGEDTANLSLCDGIEIIEHPKEKELLDIQDEKEAMEKGILPEVKDGHVDVKSEAGRFKGVHYNACSEEVFSKVQELNSYVQMDYSSKQAHRKSKRG